jgi:putative transposase
LESVLSQFVSLLKYKCDWYRRNLLKVDRFFPSSKTCSSCGTIQPSMPLSVREWTCPDCGVHHDRDINAAKNILTAGLAGFACGAEIRPEANLLKA